MRIVSEWSDHGDGLNVLPQRKRLRRILEEDDPLARGETAGEELFGSERVPSLARDVAEAVRILEKAKRVLDSKHAMDRRIHERFRNSSGADGRTEAIEIHIVGHVDIHAGAEAEDSCFPSVRGHTVRDQLADSTPVADDCSLEAPALTQHIPEQPVARVRRSATDVVE